MNDANRSPSTLTVQGREFEMFRLDAAGGGFASLPYSLKVLLENLLRHEDGVNVTRADVEALASWDPSADPSAEIVFTPARVLLQDFTGVPAVVDLAAMRDAVRALGGEPGRVTPLAPAELVIDHSLQVDRHGRPDASDLNARIEFERNRERYQFLRWGQNAFSNFQVVPPDTGIVHQINLEYLARVVFDQAPDGSARAFPDTVVGADSHTTMINGLGVLGWGVGGIEAEAAMLGQPIPLLIPRVVGFRLEGRLPEGATATDLVLTVVERLRAHGVVGKFVEFFGPGLDELPVADRATIANMAPEYGATCGIFPIDGETLRYLALSGRDPDRIALVEAYARAQGMFREPGEASSARYSEVLELDMGSVRPCIAGPRRPQDRIPLDGAKSAVHDAIAAVREGRGGDGGRAGLELDSGPCELVDGAVAIAAITSCTNTSNPAVMLGAGLLAERARARGLSVKPWVKTSLAPGSLVVKSYLEKAGVLGSLESLGFHVVGYGCTTCIGNSGPLPPAVSEGIAAGDVIACSVLSGNRNFEGRVHPEVRMNFLASPPLVVAYALAGTTLFDFATDPLGHDREGRPVFLRDVWPSQKDVQEAIAGSIGSDMFRDRYGDVYRGDERWRGMEASASEGYEWSEDSTYVRNPPYFAGMAAEPPGFGEIEGARALVVLGDSITTDHISPAGSIQEGSPAGRYLTGLGVTPAEFNSYGARRGNHEVMMRGTFANIRLRNRLAPGAEGSWTTHLPSGERTSIYDAAMRYREEGTPLIVLAGREYGAGSSRDWAAKGPALLGVRAALVESIERIHRSNLIGMGVLPLQFRDGENADTLGLDGTEVYTTEGLEPGARAVTVIAAPAAAGGGAPKRFTARVRIDTPKEWDYFGHGGILHYVVRQLAA